MAKANSVTEADVLEAHLEIRSAGYLEKTAEQFKLAWDLSLLEVFTGTTLEQVRAQCASDAKSSNSTLSACARAIMDMGHSLEVSKDEYAARRRRAEEKQQALLKRYRVAQFNARLAKAGER